MQVLQVCSAYRLRLTSCIGGSAVSPAARSPSAGRRTAPPTDALAGCYLITVATANFRRVPAGQAIGIILIFKQPRIIYHDKCHGRIGVMDSRMWRHEYSDSLS